jgi:hypothetical protein
MKRVQYHRYGGPEVPRVEVTCLLSSTATFKTTSITKSGDWYLIMGDRR